MKTQLELYGCRKHLDRSTSTEEEIRKYMVTE